MTSDPAEAGYFGVYLWKAMVEKAGSTEVAKVKEARSQARSALQPPEGMVKIDGETQHTYKIVRIGKVNAEGLIDTVWSTPDAVKPDPYLKNIEWAKGIADSVQQ